LVPSEEKPARTFHPRFRRWGQSAIEPGHGRGVNPQRRRNQRRAGARPRRIVIAGDRERPIAGCVDTIGVPGGHELRTFAVKRRMHLLDYRPEVQGRRRVQRDFGVHCWAWVSTGQQQARPRKKQRPLSDGTSELRLHHCLLQLKSLIVALVSVMMDAILSSGFFNDFIAAALARKESKVLMNHGDLFLTVCALH